MKKQHNVGTLLIGRKVSHFYDLKASGDAPHACGCIVLVIDSKLTLQYAKEYWCQALTSDGQIVSILHDDFDEL